MSKIKRFPYSAKRTRRVNTNKRIVPCLVSERWLKFPETISSMNAGGYLNIDVMTKSYTNGEDGKERKLCELVLLKEDLEEMLKEYEKSENIR